MRPPSNPTVGPAEVPNRFDEETSNPVDRRAYDPAQLLSSPPPACGQAKEGSAVKPANGNPCAAAGAGARAAAPSMRPAARRRSEGESGRAGTGRRYTETVRWDRLAGPGQTWRRGRGHARRHRLARYRPRVEGRRRACSHPLSLHESESLQRGEGAFAGGVLRWLQG